MAKEKKPKEKRVAWYIYTSMDKQRRTLYIALKHLDGNPTQNPRETIEDLNLDNLRKQLSKLGFVCIYEHPGNPNFESWIDAALIAELEERDRRRAMN